MDFLIQNFAEVSTSGTYVEGVGDEVVVAFSSVLFFVLSSTFLIFKWMNHNTLQAIHPDSQENVNATRSQLGIGDTDTTDTTDANSGEEPQHDATHQRFYSDRRCPICLLDARYAAETNCGHLFCGQCILTYWQYGNWLGAVQCPVCRQLVSLLMRDFPHDGESNEACEVERGINDYNRRFSGQPRPVLDYVRDLPAILRHLWRELFSVGGLVFMFRARILLCVAAILIYLISPLDILPEAVFGIIGLLDDIFVILLVLVYMTIIYRQIVADRGG